MQALKKKLKKQLFYWLAPYGFSVDGIKPPGYLPKSARHYQTLGHANLREYFQSQWQSNTQARCDEVMRLFFQGRLQGNEHVVEIGTGVGFVTHSLLTLFPKLRFYSFELDSYLSEYLQKEFSGFDFTSMKCHGESLQPIQDQSVEVVLAFGVFTYLNFSNMIKYFDEIARITKPGGYLFFDIFDTDSLSDAMIGAFTDHARRGDNRPYVSGALLQKLLAQLGFHLAQQFQEPSTQDFYSTKFLFQKR